MRNRVYGLLGIGAKMANWNAGFNGRPKQTLDGAIYGSDKALKYSIRHFWKENNEKVLYYKQYKTKPVKKGKDQETLSPLSLKEAYEKLFDQPLDPKNTNLTDVLRSLFRAIDVVNFGGTFAVEGFNSSITGAVQIGQGFNVDPSATVEIQDILSPFPSNEDKIQSSIGKQIMLNEGHYVYPFSINPINYESYVQLLGIVHPYTKEAYNKFKEAALKGATYLNSVSKMGCYNEFALFITLKEDSLLYLEPMDSLVIFTKENYLPTYDFSIIQERLRDVEESIEEAILYCNPYQTKIKGADFFTKKSLFT